MAFLSFVLDHDKHVEKALLMHLTNLECLSIFCSGINVQFWLHELHTFLIKGSLINTFKN